MPLKLMYITNRPEVAAIAQKSGVDRIFIDMEYIGKDDRQGGMNTVQNHHTAEDVKSIKSITDKGDAELLVRINPIHNAAQGHYSSEEEIEAVIAAGADVIMLPMFKTRAEVDRFLKAVGGRAKTMLLLETAEAAENAEEIISAGGFDEIHIGLNDLHLALGKSFMFELFIDGTAERLVEVIKKYNIPFGIGGIARIGYGMLPAEYIITEHYRLGSTGAILSRSFCDANKATDMAELEGIFKTGVQNIRNFEKQAERFTKEQFAENIKATKELIQKIISKK